MLLYVQYICMCVGNKLSLENSKIINLLKIAKKQAACQKQKYKRNEKHNAKNTHTNLKKQTKSEEKSEQTKINATH